MSNYKKHHKPHRLFTVWFFAINWKWIPMMSSFFCVCWRALCSSEVVFRLFSVLCFARWKNWIFIEEKIWSGKFSLYVFTLLFSEHSDMTWQTQWWYENLNWEHFTVSTIFNNATAETFWGECLIVCIYNTVHDWKSSNFINILWRICLCASGRASDGWRQSSKQARWHFWWNFYRKIDFGIFFFFKFKMNWRRLTNCRQFSGTFETS